MTLLSDEDREVLYADELALDNLHADWGRDALDAAVERIVARHRAEALRDAAKSLPGFAADIRTHGDAARWLRERADQIGATR